MFQRFYTYMKDYRKYGLLSCICVALEVMSELVIPLVMADIIDVGVATGDRTYILVKGIQMCALALIALALGMLYARFAALCGQGLGSELRKAEYAKIQSFSFSNTDHFSTSSLVTRLTSDVTVIQNSVTTGIRPLVRAPVMMLTALILSFTINWELALVFLVAIPLLSACLFYIITHVRALYSRMQKAIDMVNRIVQENLMAIRVVKAYVREDYEMEKFDEVNTELQTVSERAFGMACLNMPAMQYVMYATILAILWFGGNLILAGGMQVGELTGFLSYILQILNSLMMISNVFMMLNRAMASGHRILEVLDEEVEIQDESTENREIRQGGIAFEHVYFKYEKEAEEYVLSDVSFSIQAGQTVGIIGGTGSAKTTLVQLIPRLYEATGGTVLLDGIPVREYPLNHLRDAIAVVLQKNTLFSGTLRENLQWGKEDATEEELQQACRIAGAEEFIEKFPLGYDTYLEQGGVNLSGGQKQRLCIARAVLRNPKILILDDSTSAVDTGTEKKIREGLAKNLPDTTKLIIAQRISSVSHADQIIIMEDGRVHAIGNHETLLASDPIYQEIYHSQQEGVGL
ncbi:MAG: ABC transporter ATP-binding protein [Hungatella sp.]